MTPKSPDKLLAQIKCQRQKRNSLGHERTAEGMETPTPKRGEFIGNLAKVVRRKK
jgi:hypothetical protein